jgi:hypothetical protein
MSNFSIISSLGSYISRNSQRLWKKILTGRLISKENAEI